MGLIVLQGPKHFSGCDLCFQRSLSQEQSRGQCLGSESREDPAVSRGERRRGQGWTEGLFGDSCKQCFRGDLA